MQGPQFNSGESGDKSSDKGGYVANALLARNERNKVNILSTLTLVIVTLTRIESRPKAKKSTDQVG